MKCVRTRGPRDERGAALMLAIAFMLVIGTISGALLSSVTSGLDDRNALDQARNREYAADGLIDYAIGQARGPAASWDAGSPPSVTTFLQSAATKGCGGFSTSTALDGVDVRVDCTPAPAQTRFGYLQRNAIFIACLNTGTACTDGSTIVRAQINFSDTASGPTTVQAWSVNR